MSVTGYAFAWDYLEDPAAVGRTLELGVDVVALAATYHAARVVSPLHPTRRVTEIPYSAFYGRQRNEVWRDRRLRPRSPLWLGREDALATSAQRLSEEGLGVDAWIVLTHLDDPELVDDDLVEHNAFGEIYPYALCPSSEDVREYCVTLVEESLRSFDARGVVLESCGPTGFDHASAHDKSPFATLSDSQRQLLSLCFCAACQRGLRERGLDPEDVATRVRAGIDDRVSSPDDALGEELAHEVSRYRLALGVALRDAVIAAVRRMQPQAAVTVHASANRWSTGSFPTLGVDPWNAEINTVVANAWNESTAYSTLHSMTSLLEARAKTGAYVRMDRGWSEADVEDTMRRYVSSSVDELHLYHLGLLSAERWSATRRVVESFRTISSRSSTSSP